MLLRRRRKFSGYFHVERLKARRWRDGTFEYLVVWEPKSNGDPWYDTWEPENYITEELKESFKSTLVLSGSR